MKFQESTANTTGGTIFLFSLNNFLIKDQISLRYLLMKISLFVIINPKTDEITLHRGDH